MVGLGVGHYVHVHADFQDVRKALLLVDLLYALWEGRWNGRCYPRRLSRRPVVSVRTVLEFISNIGHNAGAFTRMQLFIHAPECDSNHIAMMKIAAERVAEFEPQLVDQIDVFRPQSRRMRTEVDENRRPIG